MLSWREKHEAAPFRDLAWWSEATLGLEPPGLGLSLVSTIQILGSPFPHSKSVLPGWVFPSSKRDTMILTCLHHPINLRDMRSVAAFIWCVQDRVVSCSSSLVSTELGWGNHLGSFIVRGHRHELAIFKVPEFDAVHSLLIAGLSGL